MREPLAGEHRGWDSQRVIAQFPALAQEIAGHRLVYLDSASTSQAPQRVIDASVTATTALRANVHRGVHTLSARATEAFEHARARVANWLGAESPSDVVLCSGTTAAINLVARSWGGANVGKGDEVLVTEMEHHSNWVPWQQLCERTGAIFRVAPLDDRGDLDLDAYEARLSSRTKLVALAHVSNALGTINPVRELIAAAHRVGAVAVVDGAQAVAHLPVDVGRLDCDFYAFSGHKMYGPTGIGALYGRPELLSSMPADDGGGGAIARVTAERTTFAPPPHRFEAGTPNISGACGLAAAIDFIDSLDRRAIELHEQDLLIYANAAIDAIPACRRLGDPASSTAVFSFVVDRVHPHDIATLLDERGIAVQAGHHCAQPVMDRFGVPATVRISFGVYNIRADIDALVAGVRAAIGVMSR